jgi:CheY-like chemotaxis protein
MKKIKLAYLIDDDHISNFLTSRIFENTRFSERVEIFPDASQALEALKQARANSTPLPEVILFDLNMPEMDGWEFIELFTAMAINPSIPTFILTSSIDPSDREKSGQFSAIADLVTKPLTPPKVDKILKLCVDRASSKVA